MQIIKKRKKKNLYWIFPVFLLALFLCSFSLRTELKPELVLLWNTSFSMEEASDYLSKHYPQLFILEHDSNIKYSLCQAPSKTSLKVLLSELNDDPAI